MGKFSEAINIVLDIFNSSPLLSTFIWGAIGISLITTIISCLFRIITQDDSYNLVDFIKDTYEFLNEYFSFKIKVRNLMKHKLTDKELSIFSSFKDEAKIRFKDHSSVTVKDCFNFIFEKDYQKAFHNYNGSKSSKYIIKLLNRYYNLCLCEKLKFDLLYLYELKEDEQKYVFSSLLHIDTLINGYSGIPFRDYEKKQIY